MTGTLLAVTVRVEAKRWNLTITKVKPETVILDLRHTTHEPRALGLIADQLTTQIRREVDSIYEADVQLDYQHNGMTRQRQFTLEGAETGISTPKVMLSTYLGTIRDTIAARLHDLQNGFDRLHDRQQEADAEKQHPPLRDLKSVVETQHGYRIIRTEAELIVATHLSEVDLDKLEKGMYTRLEQITSSTNEDVDFKFEIFAGDNRVTSFGVQQHRKPRKPTDEEAQRAIHARAQSYFLALAGNL